MRDFRKYDVWRRGHRLVLDLYDLSARFPDHERYTLRSQLRRAGISIPANLAEGCGYHSDGNFRRFVDHAAGSSKEVEYHTFLACELGYIDEREYLAVERRLQTLQKMLRRLYEALS